MAKNSTSYVNIQKAQLVSCQAVPVRQTACFLCFHTIQPAVSASTAQQYLLAESASSTCWLNGMTV